MRIFIHNVDSYVGKTLVKELRKVGPDGGCHRVFGTASKPEDAPKVVKRIVSRDDPKKAKKMMDTIQSCKIVIMDLFNSTLEDLMFAISALKVDPKAEGGPAATGELESEVIFILISSAIVWAATPTDGADNAILRDSDYKKRQPMPGSDWVQWREMEDLVMTCFNREGETPSQVKGYVVGAGAFYGEGELTFGPMFQSAWCGVQEHTIVAPGTNRVPTVHVRDLCRLVRQIGSTEGLNPMETPYFLAVDQPLADGADRGPPPTQKDIIYSIINELTVSYDPQVVNVPHEEMDAMQQRMSLDVWLEPSSLMLNEDFGSTCEPPGWICRDGLIANVRKIAEEFCKERGLRPMRVIIGGPPGSGKSTLCKAVAEHFNVPHLTLTKDNLDSMASQLGSKVCRYRGYVLDAGYVGFEEAERLFRYDVEVPLTEEEEAEAEAAKAAAEEAGEEAAAKQPKIERRLNEEICPTFVVVTQAHEALCRARWKATGKEMSEFQEFMERYTKNNLAGDEHCMSDFFQEVVKTAMLNLPVAGRDPEELFESVRIYMESQGRPFNYLPNEEEVATQVLAQRTSKLQELKAKAAAEKTSDKAGDAKAHKGAIQMQETRMALVEKHKEEQQTLRELPLRDYLMRYMVPTLTEGLIEVCKVVPDNPVDYLANYLEEHAAEPPSEESQRRASTTGQPQFM